VANRATKKFISYEIPIWGKSKQIYENAKHNYLENTKKKERKNSQHTVGEMKPIE